MKFIKYHLVLLLVSPISHADLLYCKDQSPRAYPKSPNSEEEKVLNQRKQVAVDCKDLSDVMNNLELGAKKLVFPNQTKCDRPASNMKTYFELTKKCEENPRALDGNNGFGCDKLWLLKQSIERAVEKSLWECSIAQWESGK